MQYHDNRTASPASPPLLRTSYALASIYLTYYHSRYKTGDVPAYRRDSRCPTPQTHRVETQYSRTARLAHVSNILRVKSHSNPLTVKTYFSITLSGNRL